ncbi:hypothetical protein GCM10007047_10510 [Cerasicoccus arenae]|uniref:Serine protease n=1 Tax=Cerasicoccus arenae TaxID=424488 RepID=A0A8J3DAT5_9BACT|nr:hypothetical protein GCM10007047_10510 [Cerasicoccus arenae]
MVVASLLLPVLLRAQAPTSTETLPTPTARTLYNQPRDGVPLLLRARETYANCATYRAQGAVRIVIYEESENGGGFLFQGQNGPARAKRYKLFSTAFTRKPFALRHEIVSFGHGRSFTSVDFWSAQRHATDHFSSSPLPLSSEALASAIHENNYLLINYDPTPEWLLASNEALEDALPSKLDWFTDKRKFPRDAWWVGEENLAGVATDLVVWKNSDGTHVAVWLTREPVAIVKTMAERAEEKEYANVTALIQPEFGVKVTPEELTLNRPRPAFFDIDPNGIVFGALDLPAIPADNVAVAPAATVTEIDQTPRTTVTPTPSEPEPIPEPEQPRSGSIFAPIASDKLPGEQVMEEVVEAETKQTLLTAEQLAAIVVIEGDKGVGTGFFCNIRGRDFIVTNQHVLSGHRQLRLRTVNGDPVDAQDIYGAIGHDIAVIAVNNTQGSLKAAINVAEDTHIKDRVVVPGNKLGGGVVTQVEGQVLGIGPDRVEIDARFVPGNSGSPIIDLDTGEVIAVATYVRKDMPDNFAEEEALRGDIEKDGAIIRWFGYRIDSVTQWEQISWPKWQRQYDMVRQFNDDSVAIYNYLTDKPAFYNNDELRRLYDDYLEAMSDRKQRTEYYERETKLFLQHVINFAKRDLDDVSKTHFYDYFKSTAGAEDNIEKNIEYRRRLISHLTRIRDTNWRILYQRVRN